MTAELWNVTHDGERKGGPFNGHNEAFAYLLRAQGQSVHYATTYGGWAIVPVAPFEERDPYYTLEGADVGASNIRAFGRVWPVANILGRVLLEDVGKRAYLNASGFVSVENNDQRDRRVIAEARKARTVAEAITETEPTI